MLVRPFSLICGLFLLGCAGLLGEDSAGADADADGDGYAAAEDCDDGDAAVNPGEVEICDDQNVDEDCDGLADDDDEPDGRLTWAIDDDGDGYGAEGGDTTRACDAPSGYGLDATDCDDDDDEVYAGAPEVCDDKDDDCDGGVDESDPEGVTGEAMVYPDDDGDGFGDESAGVYTCTPGARIETGGDCDDGDPAVNPDATEVCDAQATDENCNGSADGDDPTVDTSDLPQWYRDADGDGYGDPGDVRAACAAPGGYIASADDCDDTDAAVSPDADEVCNDGVDNDCSGGAVGCAPTGSGAIASFSDAKITGSAASDVLGSYLTGNAGDLDGDGADELAMLPAQSGSLAIFRHVPSGTVSVSTADLRVSGLGGGGALAGGHDFTGDGQDDLVVGVPSAASYNGVAYLWDGPLGSGESASTARTTFTGVTTTTPMGESLAAGDNDGDGSSDLFLIAGFYAYVHEGPVASGAVASGSAAASVYGLWSTQSVDVGDVDADGFDDLVAAAPGYGSSGLVRVVHGPVSGDVSWGSALGEEIDGATISRATFGTDVAVGDLDGDGYADLVASEPQLDRVYFVPGPPRSDTVAFQATATITSSATSLCLGDLDGDGNLDLGVGLGGAFNDGSLGLFYGPSISSGALTSADLYLTGPSGKETGVGDSCALVDVDGTGRAELAVGASWDATSASYAGAVYLFEGTGM